MLNLSELCQYKVKIVRDIDVKIEDKKNRRGRSKREARREDAKRPSVRHLEGSEEAKPPMLNELMKFIAKYFHVKYLSFIEGATCEVTLEEVVHKIHSEIQNILVYVNYCGQRIFSFGVYTGGKWFHSLPVPIPMREFIKYMSDINKYNLMRVDMRRIYVKYISTNYLTILPLAVTLTLCNQHRRIFPKDILNIIIKKIFFK